jgi:hypothetical protein
MPEIPNYIFAKGTRWREFAWQPGDKLVRSDLPAEAVEALIKQLAEDGNIVAEPAPVEGVSAAPKKKREES